MTDRVVLVGMMGSGKTTVGRALAVRLGWAYWDNDAELRVIAGAGPDEIARTRGRRALHRLEALVLRRALTVPPPVVVSAPGSAVTVGELRDRLRREYVVWLRARPETLAARVGRGSGRPLDPDMSVLGTLRRLATRRETHYAEVADLVVDVDALTPDEIVDLVAHAWSASRQTGT